MMQLSWKSITQITRVNIPETTCITEDIPKESRKQLEMNSRIKLYFKNLEENLWEQRRLKINELIIRNLGRRCRGGLLCSPG
jgi:hypothetical protein